MARTAGDNTVPTSIRLSPDLYKKLDEARESRSLGEEIRQRLTASFEGAPSGADPKTAEFLTLLAQAAATIAEHYGVWHEDPRAHAIFKRAIEYGLVDYDPSAKQPVEWSAEQKAEIDLAARMSAGFFKSVW